jgi:hypothetical protein
VSPRENSFNHIPLASAKSVMTENFEQNIGRSLHVWDVSCKSGRFN